MEYDVNSSEFIQQIRTHARHLFSPVLISGDLLIHAFSEFEDELIFYTKLLNVTFEDVSIVELFTNAYEYVSAHRKRELTISYHSSSIKHVSLSRFGLIEMKVVMLVNMGSELNEIRFTMLAHLMHGRNETNMQGFTPETLPTTVFGTHLNKSDVPTLLDSLAPAMKKLFVSIESFLSETKE